MSMPEVIQTTERIFAETPEACADSILDDTDKPLLSDAPEWLTRDYMEKCLRSHYKDSHLRITDIVASPAIGKGENYCGVLTRIRAEFSLRNGTSKVGHYIVKSSFEADEFARKIMEPYDIFNREMSIYETVLPKLNALLRAAGDTEQLFAETIAVDYARSALIFEDLNVRDFVMPDRIKGLDMKLTKIVLRKLAKMHATSAVLNEREQHCLEDFDRGMFNRYTENYAPCFGGLLEACQRMVSQWGAEFELYAKKLAALRPMYMELAKRVFDPTEGHLNVLAHGDFWTNNVMVKYDKVSGEPMDVIIIDFQYSAWGSPAIDLYYFLNTSLKTEMHISQQDELIQHYYNVLANTLRKLSYKANIPSLHKFHLQIGEKDFYAFNGTCIIQPVQRVEETDDADFNSLMQQNDRAINFKNTCFKNPYCQNMIRKLLPMYERRGLLDVDQ